jgi:hypothetical protein
MSIHVDLEMPANEAHAIFSDFGRTISYYFDEKHPDAHNLLQSFLDSLPNEVFNAFLEEMNRKRPAYVNNTSTNNVDNNKNNNAQTAAINNDESANNNNDVIVNEVAKNESTEDFAAKLATIYDHVYSTANSSQRKRDLRALLLMFLPRNLQAVRLAHDDDLSSTTTRIGNVIDKLGPTDSGGGPTKLNRINKRRHVDSDFESFDVNTNLRSSNNGYNCNNSNNNKSSELRPIRQEGQCGRCLQTGHYAAFYTAPAPFRSLQDQH